jgi:hypothetical protein
MTSPPALLANDPIRQAILRAPQTTRLTPEQRAELAQDLADIAAGRVTLVAGDEVPAWLEAHARELGELDE